MDGSPLTHVVPAKKTQLETEAHTLVQSVRIMKARIYRVSAFRLLVAWWCGGDSLGELWAPCNPHSLQLLLTLPIHLWLQCPIFWCCFQQENNPRHKAHFCWYFTQKHDSRIQANTAVISNKLFIDTIINSQHCNRSRQLEIIECILVTLWDTNDWLLILSISQYHQYVGGCPPTFSIWDKVSGFSIFKNFIWNNKRSRLRLSLLYLPYERGGLQLPDLMWYFWAQIRAAAFCFVNEQTPTWVSVHRN